jgi:hypothetical protein
MATSTTSNYQPNRDAVIAGGLKLAGILSVGDVPTAEQYADGMEILMDGMLDLQNSGLILRTRVFEPLTLVAGQASYSAPADTLDVESGGVVRDTNGHDAPLDCIAIKEYWQLADKTLQGRPIKYFPDYTSTGVTLYLYQVPTSEWVTLYYPRTRKVRDLETGNLDLDCPTKWMLGLKMYVAYMFSLRYRKSLEATEQRRVAWEGEDGSGGIKARMIAAETPKGDTMFIAEDIFIRG